MRGGEKCLEALCEVYPEAPIYTLFHEPGKVSAKIACHRIVTSPVQRIPGIFKSYRYFLPLFPPAISTFYIRDRAVVVSFNHCVAKGIRMAPNTRHICYCFTPMRYAWDLFDDYFSNKGPFFRAFIRTVLGWIRMWDKRNRGVDVFVAISHHVARRIKRCYEREALVVYPPVDTEFYTPDPSRPRGDFYLIVSALVPYKKIDVAIRAFNRLGKRLVIVGIGPEETHLKVLAKPNVEFLGWQTDENIRALYREAKALVFPGEEDFGIVPVEAQACGCPVIAYKKGGALETILEERTGIFFEELSEKGIIDAVSDFDRIRYDTEAIRLNTLRFGKARFQLEMRTIIEGTHDS